MMFTTSQQWVLVGIASYEYGCANPAYVSVYTRLVSYVNWIHEMNVVDAITADQSSSYSSLYISYIPATIMTINGFHSTSDTLLYYRCFYAFFISVYKLMI